MSVISTKHQFIPFVSSPRSKPFDGQRLVKVSYKTPKSGEEKKQSVCVSIPQIDREVVKSNIDNLFEYVIAMLQGTQDSIIKRLHSEEGAVNVDDEDIDLTACIAELEKQGRGGRLSGELIKEWFDGALRDILRAAMAEKNGLSDHPERWSDAQVRKMDQALNAYADSFAAMAGYRTLYANDKCDKLMRALALVEDDSDTIANGLVKRLQDMKLVAEKAEEEFSL